MIEIQNILNLLKEYSVVFTALFVAATLGLASTAFKKGFGASFLFKTDRIEEYEEILNLKNRINEIELRQKQDDKKSEITLESLGFTENDARSQVTRMVLEQLQRLSEIDSPILSKTQERINQAIIDRIFQSNFSEIIEKQNQLENTRLQEKNTAHYESILQRQLSSANNTKSVMMNLFFAFAFLGMAAVVTVPSLLADNGGIYMLGIQISVSAFIIYLYRSSNTRTATILSIIEDQRKLSEATIFMKKFESSTNFTNNDIEAMKSILTNRFSQERGAEHPYEIILKGVTNSTVLLKGGKVSNGSAPIK